MKFLIVKACLSEFIFIINFFFLTIIGEPSIFLLIPDNAFFSHCNRFTIFCNIQIKNSKL